MRSSQKSEHKSAQVRWDPAIDVQPPIEHPLYNGNNRDIGGLRGNMRYFHKRNIKRWEAEPHLAYMEVVARGLNSY